MTTDSDSECSYVANLADFNVIIVIIKIVYNSKKSNYSKKSNNSKNNNMSNNSNYSNKNNNSNYS